MLNRLGAREHAGVTHVRILCVAHNFLGFLQNSLDAWTPFALRLQIAQLEHLFQPGDLLLGLREMLLDCLRQFHGLGLLGHFRKVLDELLLCVINVLQLMYKQILHSLEGHVAFLSCVAVSEQCQSKHLVPRITRDKGHKLDGLAARLALFPLDQPSYLIDLRFHPIR